MRRVLSLSADLVCVSCATLLALALRGNVELPYEKITALLPYLGATLLMVAIVFPATGIDRAIWRYSDLGDFLRLAAAVIFAVAGAVALGFAVNRMDGVARSLPILQAVLAASLMMLMRVAARVYHGRRTDGEPLPLPVHAAQETVIVVGMGPVAELFLRSAEELMGDRVRVAGIIGRDKRFNGRRCHNRAILGAPEDLSTVLRELEVHGVFVDRIVVTVDAGQLPREARDVLARLKARDDLVIDYLPERLGLVEPGCSGALSAQELGEVRAAETDAALTLRELIHSPVLARPYWTWKSVLDRTGAAVLVVLLAPLLILVSLLAMADVGRAFIFWQERPGLMGRPFRLYKFRTMRDAYDEDGRRIPDALRLSAVGRLLRESRLDELPQLFNILLGEMSFIGPRPLLPGDQAPEHSARLAVRPGLTGWAQVNGGRDVDAAEKTAMDLWYILNASFRVDAEIALRTLRFVFGEMGMGVPLPARPWMQHALDVREPAAR